jgi:vacuolar-type H+-ATPase subunit I/STV1
MKPTPARSETAEAGAAYCWWSADSALLTEVRLLRQAIERQTATATRAQLLVGRLTLQDQRVARARAAVERIEKELSSVAQESGSANSSLSEMQRMIEDERDSSRRAQLERDFRLSQPRLKEMEALAADLESRHSQALQALAAEMTQFEQLESVLAQLDRAVGPSKE